MYSLLYSGIAGMQPADLKGDGGRQHVWSCYDPNRIKKEDYANLPMPTEALQRALASDMIESVDGGVFKFHM
jgi:hypothetical protein